MECFIYYAYVRAKRDDTETTSEQLTTRKRVSRIKFRSLNNRSISEGRTMDDDPSTVKVKITSSVVCVSIIRNSLLPARDLHRVSSSLWSTIRHLAHVSNVVQTLVTNFWTNSLSVERVEKLEEEKPRVFYSEKWTLRVKARSNEKLTSLLSDGNFDVKVVYTIIQFLFFFLVVKIDFRIIENCLFHVRSSSVETWREICIVGWNDS